MKASALLALIQSEPWFITSNELAKLERLASSDIELAKLPERPAFSALGGNQNQPGAIALVSIHGPIINRAGWLADYYTLTDPQQLAATLRTLALDPNIAQIILDVDSPGGTVSGTAVAGEAVAFAASKKPVTAVVNDMMASAAYWIGSQATKIIVRPDGLAGSIGVITKHFDYTAMLENMGIKVTILRTGAKKALGQPEEAMTEEIQADIMAELQSYLDLFVSAVAQGRGVPESKIKALADGSVFIGAEAVKVGLADEIGTLDGVITLALATGANARGGKKGSMNLKIRKPDGTVVDVDTDSATAQIDLDTHVQASIQYASDDAKQKTLEAHAKALGIEAKDLSVEALAKIAANAEAGASYRASLETRLHEATIALEGNDEAATAHANIVLETAKTASLTSLEALVKKAEKDRDAKFPGGRISGETVDGAEATAGNDTRFDYV